MKHTKLWDKLETHISNGQVVKVTSCETSDRIDGVVTTVSKKDARLAFSTHMFMVEGSVPSLFWGHYDMSRGEAMADHNLRANNL